MVQFISLSFFIVLCGASIIQVPKNVLNLENTEDWMTLRDLEHIQEEWEPHIRDFLDLIDVQKVMKVALGYITDPDVIEFINFISSPEFKDIVLDFEALDEFIEAVDHLESKGYEIKPIIELFNSLLQLNKAPTTIPKTPGKGPTNLIKDIIQVLPIEDMKILFKEKLYTSPEVKELYEALSSEEFKDIMKRLSENPKLVEIKNVFEHYGLDINELKSTFGDIAGSQQ